MTELTVNFSDPAAQADLFSRLRQLRGPHRLTLLRHRPRRTDAQNRFLWSCVNRTFGDYMREQEPDWTDEMSHQTLRAKFLRVPVLNRRTGEVVGDRVRSTTELNIEEFMVYLDACIAWLADMFDLVCPDPALYGASPSFPPTADGQLNTGRRLSVAPANPNRKKGVLLRPNSTTAPQNARQ